MLASWMQIVAKIGAGAVLALPLAICARLPFPRVCEFQPRFLVSYFAFVVGCIAVVVWNELVTVGRDLFIDENTGIALILAASIRWIGSFVLIAASVAYLVHDRKGRPIGLASATVVSLLAAVMTAPIGLIVFGITAVLYMPHAPI